MIEHLKKFIMAQSNIPEDEWGYFVSLLKSRELEKGEILFHQNEKTDIIAFVLKGLLITYYLDYKNEKKVKKFSNEGNIVSPYAALLAGEPASRFTAEALENSTIYFIRYDELVNLYARHPCWQKLGRRFAEISLIEKERREYETLCLPMSEQYQSFLKHNGEIVNRVPQYLIASYMGITAVSLSRLRAQKVKKT